MCLEDALAAREISDAAAQQEQIAERQGVGSERPLAVSRRDVQASLDRGQGDGVVDLARGVGPEPVIGGGGPNGRGSRPSRRRG